MASETQILVSGESVAAARARVVLKRTARMIAGGASAGEAVAQVRRDLARFFVEEAAERDLAALEQYAAVAS